MKKTKRKYGFIYKMTNIVNGKIYIGKTECSIERRFKEHLRYCDIYNNQIEKSFNTRLYPAMLKYGKENFKIELVERLIINDVDINEREKYWISFYNSQNGSIGYNISPGGLGGPLFKGRKHSVESKNKMRASSPWKGKKQSKDLIIKRSLNRRKYIQNLNTGEVFKGYKDAQSKYESSVGDACRNHRRAKGCFFIQLENNDNISYTQEERQRLINEYESRLEINQIEANEKRREKIKNIVLTDEKIKSRQQAYKESGELRRRKIINKILEDKNINYKEYIENHEKYINNCPNKMLSKIYEISYEQVRTLNKYFNLEKSNSNNHYGKTNK